MKYKTLKFHLKLNGNKTRLLRLVCHIAKNIYNVALYNLREEYFKNARVLGFNELKLRVKENPNYKLIDPYQSSCIIRNAIKALNLYNKYYYSNKNIREEYQNDLNAKKISFPKYKSKLDYMGIEFSNIKIEKDNRGKFFIFPLAYLVKTGKVFDFYHKDELIATFVNESKLKGKQELKIYLPRSIANKNLKEIKIVPKQKETIFEIQYIFIDIEKAKSYLDLTEDMALDLGVTNMATGIITNNYSFIIDGKILKSLLRLYNKNIANARKKLPIIDKEANKQQSGSKRIAALYNRLNNHIENYLNNAVKILYDIALENKVKRIIIGWCYGFKTKGIETKLSRMTDARINQSLVMMPLARFRNKIINKAKKYNIEVKVQDEAYTSVASFYDKDDFYKKNFSGERIKRGLYRRKDGKIINADLNGAMNIYRKFVTEGNQSKEKLNFLLCSGIPIPNRIRVLLKTS